MSTHYLDQRFEPVTGVTVAAPVGAAVTDTGWTFTVEPADPYTQPFRLRCAHCPWQATTAGTNGGAMIAALIRRHASAHADEAHRGPTRTGWLPLRLRTRGRGEPTDLTHGHPQPTQPRWRPAKEFR